MDPPSIETVYQAISALYDNPNTSEKEQASAWLGEVQKSVHSWTISDELLQKKKDVQSCYFAAQTLRSKIQNNLAELTQEAVISLRNSIIVHLECMSAETSGAILTQLSLALANLALQTPSWQNCVGDLLATYSNKNQVVLLEILTVLPQEIDSRTLKLGENRRAEIKAEFRANSQNVTLFLKECLSNSQNQQVAQKVVKCMTSWIQVQAINIQEVPQNDVIGFCLQVLSDTHSTSTLHDTASDCICALLSCVVESSNDDSVERLLFNSISSLENSYHMAVVNEEEERVANYARVFTELAESFLDKIVVCASAGETHFAKKSLDLVLITVGHHEYEIAEISFNLWYRLSEELYHRDYEPLTKTFQPHIERLITALARHCQFEPDQQQLPEEGDDFYDFRQKVQELIRDVVFIAGSGSVFRQMFGALLRHSQAGWEQTEAALFIMQAVAKNILPDEYEYVPKVVEAILGMPETTHPAVRRTCILLLGELSEWVERHPECLDACVAFLLAAVPDTRLAAAVATALQSICRSCRSLCGGHVVSLLALSGALGALGVAPRAAAALLRALAAALGALPPEQLTTALREATAVHVNNLQSCLNPPAGADPAAPPPPPGDPAVHLDRLAALFRDVDPPEESRAACLPAFADAWPTLRDTMIKYGSSGRIMERWCRCVRFAVRLARRHAAPCLPPLTAALAALYSAQRHSCLLYLASILVDELHAVESCVSPLLELATQLLPPALELMQTREQQQDQPDTVDDMFRLCTRYMQRLGAGFVSCGALRAVLPAAAHAAALHHRDANAAAFRLLQQLADTHTEAIDELLLEWGQRLTSAVLEAALLHLPTQACGDASDTLLALSRRGARLGRAGAGAGGGDAGAGGWLARAAVELPDAPPAPTPQQKEQMVMQIQRVEKSKDLTKLLREYSKLYR